MDELIDEAYTPFEITDENGDDVVCGLVIVYCFFFASKRRVRASVHFKYKMIKKKTMAKAKNKDVLCVCIHSLQVGMLRSNRNCFRT